MFLAYPLHQLLGGDPLLLGTQHDRRTVGVVGADIDALVAAHTLEPRPDVGLDVFYQMAQVDGTIGVRQGAGDQDVAFGFGHGGYVGGGWVMRFARGPHTLPILAASCHS